MHIPTFVFIFILFLKNLLLLLLYPKHVIKLLWCNLGCYSLPLKVAQGALIMQSIESNLSQEKLKPILKSQWRLLRSRFQIIYLPKPAYKKKSEN